ncbi:MAG: Mrp/NBP35 family ATP-binding protein [Candidatus Atribacteria bacterium]|nr:Mrp/NBP35 family ATP-binding protein [Candidatus Atribacteria bacterium]
MSPKISAETILAALSKVQEPELHKDLVTLNMVRDLEIKGEAVSFTILLTTPACPLKGSIEKAARQAALTVPGVKIVNIKMDANVPADGRLRGLLQLPVRNAIAVASGKGGVGKSTISTNLAVALAQSGARVGLMDADIYGPNIPTMMGIHEIPATKENKLIPAEAYGVKLMSMGFLVKPGQPLIWRGPMLNSAIRQFLSDVEWGELDYLIIDLPPGTGDVPLSLAQTLPLSGVVIVTLPQAVSLEDASRALEMFRTLEVPILGIIENMRGEFFGSGGGEDLARVAKVPFLGALPMEQSVRIGGDTGEPVVASRPDSDAAKALKSIAEQVAARVSVTALEQNNVPKINIL